MNRVAHGDVAAQEDPELLFHAMQNAAVLHIRIGAHANGVDVAPQNGIHPDAGVLVQHHIAR
jgi:hypothetical protein